MYGGGLCAWSLTARPFGTLTVQLCCGGVVMGGSFWSELERITKGMADARSSVSPCPGKVGQRRGRAYGAEESTECC